jgi:2'-5' RNA ligase
VAFLGIAVEGAAARMLSRIVVPGKPVPAQKMHVTLVYLGKDVPVQGVLDAVAVVCEVCRETDPFYCEVSRVDFFSKGPDGFPVFGDVASEELRILRGNICSRLELGKIPFSKKFDYYPHVALSYAEYPIAARYGLRTPVLWRVEELTMRSDPIGAHCEGLTIRIPLRVGPPDCFETRPEYSSKQ